MSEQAALPLVVVLGIITVLMVRSREVSWWQATLIGLFGFYLALTPAVFMISELVTWIIARFSN
ncbi:MULTISPECIES: hypothetical protein [unclassified Streptomyces]|uniref:hypothetical protein n=1 Tax=unclassified Streptomyces TaxID=2593676 RepID=UPI0013C927DB|nr:MULTISPECIES: hypothetical protein [unclassified Streptomyces]MDF9815207.1 hypothetical protein [Streptomyces sp. SPB162]NEA77215.1 hypothetical protein [Streptomyces sp. SID13588]